MYNKKALSKAVSELGKAKAPAKKRDKIYTNKETLSPFVSSEGFKQGPPPPGTHYRIPGDTLYNPTPYAIDAVSDNGIRKTLNPGDTSNVHFPGASHVDEYQKQKGGQKDSWGRSNIDPWYGFNPKTKQFTVKDQWGRKPGDQWYGFNPNTKQWNKGSKAAKTSYMPPIVDAETKYNDRPLIGIGQNISGNEGMLENAFEVIDPIGATSWDDVSRSYEKEGLSPNTWLEVAGAIPIFGRASKAARAGIHLPKYKGLDKFLYRNLPQNKYLSNALNTMGVAGRGYDTYQIYDEAARPYVLNDLGPKYDEGGAYYDDELTDDEIEELRRGGYTVEELPQAQNGITYVNDLNDPRLLEYQKRLKLYNESLKKKQEWYALMKKYNINTNYFNDPGQNGRVNENDVRGTRSAFNGFRSEPVDQNGSTQWYENYYGYRPAYIPDYHTLWNTSHGDTKWDASGKRYYIYPNDPADKQWSKRIYNEDDHIKLGRGYYMYNKPDEVVYRKLEEEDKKKKEDPPVVETPPVVEEKVVEQVTPVPRLPVLKPAPDLNPEPLMVTIKQRHEGEKNIFGRIKNPTEDYWEEIQVPSNDPAVARWQERLDAARKNNPNTTLLNFTEEAINPIRREGGALLTKKVTCKDCGWTWDAADGGDDVDTCHKCGGKGLMHARKGGEKKYSRSLEAKNRLFVENKLTKKKKSKKKKIFDPNAKYYQEGAEVSTENQVECDDDGRCYETDQAQELLDKTHRTVSTALEIDKDVAAAVNKGYPANEVWQEYGVKTADQLTGDPYAFACANSATRGYAICDPNVKDTATLSNARMKNAVAQGTTPFRKVGTYTGGKYKEVVKPGNLVSFMSGNFNHMVKNVGPNKYAQSSGSVEDWNEHLGVNWVPNSFPATVYEYAPYYDEIQALEEKARTNPTYVPGTQTVGRLPLLPLANLEIAQPEREIQTSQSDLGLRQFGGIPTLPLNKGRQVLRDWVYGADIGMLQEADGGYMDLELTDEEIQRMRDLGHYVEEY